MSDAPQRRLTLYTDGAARGNPGPAGAGVSIRDESGREIDQVSEYLGEATNNVAEYSAMVMGLERAAEMGATEVEVRADSELIVKQMRGEYRVRNRGLIPFYERACALERKFASVAYVHVRRNENGDADRLANLAIDRQSLR